MATDRENLLNLFIVLNTCATIKIQEFVTLEFVHNKSVENFFLLRSSFITPQH